MSSALMIAISGVLRYTPAASASPVLVQQAVSLGASSATTLSVTLATAPVSGNTLTMLVGASNAGTLSTPTGWTLVSSTFAGVSSGKRYVFTKIADGTEGTTISLSTQSGNTGFCVNEWSGATSVVAGAGGDGAAGTGSFSVGGLSAPAATSVPVFFAMFNGNSAMPPWTWPAGWTATGPLANGSFPVRGQASAVGAATAAAVSAQTVTYTGTRGNGVVVYWVGAWIS